MDFNGARDHILLRLQNELDPCMLYHSCEHTVDVWESVRRISHSEGIGGKEAILIETAALFHDAGMLEQYNDHESASVRLMTSTLPDFDYSKEEISIISGLILATRMPQRAAGLPSQILCDGDLDYLGRDDFFIHSFRLKLEWDHFGVLKTGMQEWFSIQRRFLLEHRYFTESSQRLRNQKKSENLSEVLSLIRHS